MSTQIGQITAVTYIEADPGLFPCLRFEVEAPGASAAQSVSLSPRNAASLARLMRALGHGDLDSFDVDDETNVLVRPDLVGMAVTFESSADDLVEIVSRA